MAYLDSQAVVNQLWFLEGPWLVTLPYFLQSLNPLFIHSLPVQVCLICLVSLSLRIQRLILLHFLQNGIPLQYSWLGDPMDREPGGLLSMESQRVRHDWVTFTSLPSLYISLRVFQGSVCPIRLPGSIQGWKHRLWVQNAWFHLAHLVPGQLHTWSL